MKLQRYKAQIEDIDRQLIRLIAERNTVVKQFALYKKHQQMPPLDMKRSKEMFRTRAELANDLDISMPGFKKIYQSLLKMALDIEREAY